MSIPAYDCGDLVRLTGTFTDANGTAQDPTQVRFDFRPPGASAATTYVYGTDGQLIKDSTGNYHVDLDLNLAGRWRYRFYATGNGQSAEEKELHVRPKMV